MLVGGVPKHYEEPKPTLRVSSKHLADLKKMEVGKKYTVHAKVELVRYSQGNEYGESGDKDRHEGVFKVHSIKSDGSGPC